MLSRVRTFANDPAHRLASSAILIVLTHGERDQLLGDFDHCMPPLRNLEQLLSILYLATGSNSLLKVLVVMTMFCQCIPSLKP